jgi:ribosome-associated heat shock protein Hsp15
VKPVAPGELPQSPIDENARSVRLDKWLWAARFFKTRQLAIEAIEMGRVEVGGARVKASKALHVGDLVLIRRPPYETQLIVRAIADKRVAAPIARTYYDETAQSVEARARLASELAALPPPVFRGRPTKRDRRMIERFKANRQNDGRDAADEN